MNKTAQDLRKEYPNVDKIFKTLAELHKDRTDLMICIKEALEKKDSESLACYYAALCAFNAASKNLYESTREAKELLTPLFAENEADIDRLNKNTDELWMKLNNKEKEQH